MGLIYILDATKGTLSAIIEAKSLTAKRTAAASALASSFFIQGKFRIIADDRNRNFVRQSYQGTRFQYDPLKMFISGDATLKKQSPFASSW